MTFTSCIKGAQFSIFHCLDSPGIEVKNCSVYTPWMRCFCMLMSHTVCCLYHLNMGYIPLSGLLMVSHLTNNIHRSGFLSLQTTFIIDIRHFEAYVKRLVLRSDHELEIFRVYANECVFVCVRLANGVILYYLNKVGSDIVPWVKHLNHGASSVNFVNPFLEDNWRCVLTRPSVP